MIAECWSQGFKLRKLPGLLVLLIFRESRDAFGIAVARMWFLEPSHCVKSHSLLKQIEPALEGR